jgi:glyoxylase-like metal-dependent hydrolase (beta-lactamase superfamily II)
MAYATGRHMCHAALGGAYEAEDVCAMVRRLFAGRLQFHDGVTQLAPGLSLHRIGGHTLGIQAVRVWTRRGWVVLASDASHLYANMEQGRPYPIIYNLGDMLEGFATLKKLASSPAHIIPGHDPLVLARYPAPRPELAGIVARLDVDPL